MTPVPEDIQKRIDELIANPRPKILKLANMITSRQRKVELTDTDYWAFAAILTDEMADIALKMKLRKPRTVPRIAKLTGKSTAELQPVLDQMAYIGILEYNRENPRHELQYMVPLFVIGSGEWSNMNIELMEKYPELAAFFNQAAIEPLEPMSALIPPGGGGAGMHVVPVEKAIEAISEAVDLEHISHWLNKYEGKYAACRCACRTSMEMLGEGCADDPVGWCVLVGDMADYVVDTKRGHYIDRTGVLELLKKAEDNGFVHQITNIDGSNKILGICNCNVNTCYALRTSQLYNTPNHSRSAYVARVSTEDCVACGCCVESCPAGAVKLGQKLCAKDGPIQYPKHELPDEAEWGPAKWDINYRDTNRINCYDTGTSPCKTACPAHIAVQGYLKKAAQGKYTDALELIKRDNPFPAVCGRVCNRRCEDACTRGTVDQAVAIDEVKKFIAERDLHAATRFVPAVICPSYKGYFDEKVAIIGAGPAGLSCAYYLAKMGYKPTVFERNQKPGGMLTYGIPSFKLEKDVVDSEIDVLREMGVDIQCGIEVGKDITLTQLRAQGYQAFYVAIGCQGGRKANVPGEDTDGVTSAVEFLRTALKDETHKVSGTAVVIGGGNVAIDVARTAIRCGAGAVRMYCLESRSEMPASKEEITEAEEDGVQIDCGWGPKEVLSKDGKVTGIVLKKCVSVFDQEHRFVPKYDENSTVTIPCENVFMSIGQSIVWGNLIEGSQVKLGRGNGAVADRVTYQTDEPDIFVGGDVYTGPKFAIDAIAAGREGAVSIHRFVQPKSSLTIGRNRRQFIELGKDNIALEQYDTSARQIPNMDGSMDAKRSFRDSRLPFTEEQVKIETARCLGCGASVVDENKCIGCGICTTKCKFDAIKLYREHPECTHMVPYEKKMSVILPYAIKREIKIKRAAKRDGKQK